MYKRGLKLQDKDSLEGTLKKSAIKEQSDEEGNGLSLTQSESQKQDQIPKKHEYQLVEFEEYNLDSKGSMLRETKRRIQTDYDRSNQPPLSSRAIKDMFVDQNGIISQNSYQRKGEQQTIRELEQCKKQLLVKDGQISMLQRIINQYLGQGFSKDKESLGLQLKINNDKSIKTDEYIQKIRQLTQQIKYKNDELAKYKYENIKLQGSVQNLQNQIYVFKNREQNNRLTNSHFKKEFSHQNQTKPNSFWEDDIRPSMKLNGGIEDLQKRLDLLKENRVELERSKSKKRGKTARESTSDIKEQQHWGNQTVKTKNKNKLDLRLPQSRYENTFIERYKKKQVI